VALPSEQMAALAVTAGICMGGAGGPLAERGKWAAAALVSLVAAPTYLGWRRRADVLVAVAAGSRSRCSAFGCWPRGGVPVTYGREIPASGCRWITRAGDPPRLETSWAWWLPVVEPFGLGGVGWVDATADHAQG